MNRSFTLSGRAAWIAILILSPLAYVGSFSLAKILPSRNRPINISRESAIEIAMAFARSRNFDPQDWKVSASAEQHKDIAVLNAYDRHPVLDEVTGASLAKVRLNSPSADQWIRVVMTPAGRVVGFASSEPASPVALDDAAAEKIATAFLRDFLGPSSPFELVSPKVRFVDSKRQHRAIEWRSTVPGLPQAHANFQVEVVGDRPTREECEVVVPGSYLNRFRPWNNVKRAIQFLGATYLFVMGIFALVRYARRTMEKEVSHRRTILVAMVFLASSVFA